MGFYIETDSARDKAEYLVRKHGATVCLSSPMATFHSLKPNEMMVCVVHNGIFEAAGIIWGEEELRAFMYPDGRFREWLVMDRETVYKLNPHVKDFINEMGNRGK